MLTNCRVLVVEDNPDVTCFVCDALRRCGADVRSVPSGSAATAWMRRGFNPDVILLDLRLQENHGNEILGYLLGSAPQTPAMVMSVFMDELAQADVVTNGSTELHKLMMSVREARDNRMAMAG